MPNIHVYTDSTTYEELKPKIDQVMQELGLGDDAVTTPHWHPAESCDGKRTPMPYIVVSSTNEQEITVIIVALKKANLRLDCERLPLPENGFIPAEKMSSD